MNDSETVYIRCRTCGTYVEENQSINKIYCSEQCAHTFTRCPNCGNFFENTEKNRNSGFCSVECEAVYSENGVIISSMEVSQKTKGFLETPENLAKGQVLEEEQK
jgi:endogenous inhibitor of DNA gyrase (YacG/DUF329 family)